VPGGLAVKEATQNTIKSPRKGGEKRRKKNKKKKMTEKKKRSQWARVGTQASNRREPVVGKKRLKTAKKKRMDTNTKIAGGQWKLPRGVAKPRRP